LIVCVLVGRGNGLAGNDGDNAVMTVDYEMGDGQHAGILGVGKNVLEPLGNCSSRRRRRRSGGK